MNHQMREGGLFHHWHLRDNAPSGLLFCQPPVTHKSLKLKRLAGDEANDDIPICRPSNLKKKRDDRSPERVPGLCNPIRKLLPHKRMNHSIEPVAGVRISKHQLGKRLPIDTAPAVEHGIAEKPRQLGHSPPSRHFQTVNDIIGVKQLHAQSLKIAGKETLAARDATGYGYTHDHAD